MPASMPAETPVETVPATENYNYSNEDDESYLMEEPVLEIPQTAPETAEIPATPAVAANNVSASPQPGVIESPREFTTTETEANSDGGFFGKLLSALVWLVVGAILGVAGYYVWLTMSAKPTVETPVLAPQTDNISKTSNDKLRIEAETNPEKIIQQYETVPGKERDAFDFYILGRAYLKAKRYDEAKQQFILARNNLKAVTDEETRAVLATDITLGLTIAQDKAVQAAFEREKNIINSTQPAGQQNTNTSSGGDTAASPAG
jgi:predicted negative regulator of RcsB-dependent stress response